MSWIVKFEKEVSCCADCDIYQQQKCGHDDRRGRESFGGLGAHWIFPSEIRPCPLKVEAPTPSQDYTFETGV